MLFAMLVGSELGVIEGRYQPMKIAAAEAQWTTCQPCSFSIFQIGGGNQDQTPTQILAIPHLLSLLATNHWNGKVIGLSPLQAQYSKKYGPGSYVPERVHPVLVDAGDGLRGRPDAARRRVGAVADAAPQAGHVAGCSCGSATWAAVLPFAMNTAGWLLTESGRQPWVVQGLLLTRNGVSPTVSTATIAVSLGIFVALYGVAGRGRPAADAALRAPRAAGHLRRGHRRRCRRRRDGGRAVPAVQY